MEALALARRSGWPEDLRVLLARYPREEWDSHANLGDMARFWLSRHTMFRELSGSIGHITAQFRADTFRLANLLASSCRACSSCSTS